MFPLVLHCVPENILSMYVEAWDYCPTSLVMQPRKREREREIAQFQFMLSEANGNFPELGTLRFTTKFDLKSTGYLF